MAVTVFPQEFVRVEVSFYNQNEREKLLRYPTAADLEKITAQAIDIPIAEFLTYYLFYRKRMGLPDYQTFQSIGRRVDQALGSLEGVINFGGRSIHTRDGAIYQPPEISEHVGEAVGLSVMSRIHDVTEADWAPIPTQSGPGAARSFDFQMASDGRRFIQVENKGSSVSDNRKRGDSVSKQHSRIIDKKKDLNALAQTGTDPNPASLRYGTITVLDSRIDGNVRCLLSDPPPEPRDEPPDRFRLIQRMRFIRDWVSTISPRSQLAAALATRVAALETLRDPSELSGVPLRKGNGDPFEIVPKFFDGPHSTFLATKSRVIDGPAGGEIVQLSNDQLFLLGIREELVALAALQEREQLLAYRAPTGTIDKTVECIVSEARFRSLRLPTAIRDQAIVSGRYRHFLLDGQLHYSSFGLVFGVLPLPSR